MQAGPCGEGHRVRPTCRVAAAPCQLQPEACSGCHVGNSL
jgi:hypothetical protein